MKKSTTVTNWIFRIIILVIMVMTLPPKLSGAPEVVELFTKLGAEPIGRYTVAIFELTAAILILVSATQVYGAILAAGLMSGALMGHITKLGFEGMMGQMATFAIVALISSLVVLFIQKEKIPVIGKLISSKS
ncbi:hypothetical protein OAI07_01840 [Akkermansiaceae bacterium]|nr:hypothetical protein [Akkermansiaceae bacterium]